MTRMTRKSKIKKPALWLLTAVLLILLLPGPNLHAASRTATISGTKTAYLGQTFDVTLGFNSKILTRSCDFTLTYDNNLIQLSSVTNISGLAGTVNPGTQSPLKVLLVYMGEGQAASQIFRIRFKVKAKGTVTLKITDASDGIDGNSISAGASLTVNLTDPPPTTTTTAAPTTTTTPSETKPRHPSETVIGERYDGEPLAVPETIPSDQAIPESFQAQEVAWGKLHLLAYRSPTLPETLYWLSDAGGEARFYWHDEELSVFVPYMRAEWSARYFTFSVLAEADTPSGFDLVTIKVWGQEVPAYKPAAGHFVAKAVYDEYYASLAEEDPAPDPPELPGDLYLLALRVNDEKDKELFLYDASLDSLIRADLWIIPFAGSFLDREPTLPTETEPAESSQESQSQPTETETPAGPRTVNLFGVDLPLYLVAATGAAALLMVALAVWFFMRARRAARMEADFSLDDPDLEVEEPLKEALPPAPLVMEPLEDLAADLAEDQDMSLSQEADDPEEAAWKSLEETLRSRQVREGTDRAERRSPEIRPRLHRREDRDDPQDHEEL